MEEKSPTYFSDKREFTEFLDPADGEGLYTRKVEEMVKKHKRRLIVDVNQLRKFNADLTRRVLDNPKDTIPALEEALKDFIQNSDFGQKVQLSGADDGWRIGFEGAFGDKRVSPRQLMANYLTKQVCVEGIVTKCSLVRPKVCQTVHYCEATNKFHQQNYRDATSFSGSATGSAYPTTDEQGNPLTTEYGLCTYKDNQKVYIQDMPERTAAGTMPRTVECILDDDLVDKCKPGDRVQMIGTYRALAGRAQGQSSGKFRTVIIINQIRKIGMDEAKNAITGGDVKNIRKVAKRKDCFHLLSRSIAPSIYGHEYIKKALALMLLGGVEKNLDNGAHIRGDINMLMVGDPSCAKSQMLRAAMKISPLAINTTGRGSSGAGLTAAVTQDKDTGERRLEAGAMVLADRGIVCIDEFDKMSDSDRTAIHEVMEQQTVTIAKAGIHCSLNARCSVIAASNPVYGQYDRDKPPHENIALPDSLLSRFDLLFIVLDKLDPKLDRAISSHVLSMHKFRGKSDYDDEMDDDELDDNQNKDTEIYEKRDKVLKGAAGKMRAQSGNKVADFLTIDFCKKFIQYAKKRYAPFLTNDSAELISQKYADLRDTEAPQTLPITARCLETIIRLSTAHAKCRLSKKIEVYDVEEACKVLGFALTNDVIDGMSVDMDDGESESEEESDEMDSEDEEPRKKAKTLDSDEDMEEKEDEPKKAKRKPRRKRRKDEMSPAKSYRKDKKKRTSKKAKAAAPVEVTANDTRIVTTFMNARFKKTRADSLGIDDFFKAMQTELKASQRLNRPTFDAILNHLKDANKVFISGGEIYRL